MVQTSAAAVSDLQRVFRSRSGGPTSVLPPPNTTRSTPSRKRKPSLTSGSSSEEGRGSFQRRALPLSLLKTVFHSTHGRVAVGAAVSLWLLFQWVLADLLLMAQYKLTDHCHNKGYFTALGLRKPPLIFVHSSGSAGIVWEANHLVADEGEQLQLRYWAENEPEQIRVPQVRKERPEGEAGWRRWIHSVILEDLKPAVSYGYEIYLSPSRAGSATKPDRSRVLVNRKFTWFGRQNQLSDHGKVPSQLHIAVVGDNQFALAVWTRVLSRLARLKGYLPSSKSHYSARSYGGLQTMPSHPDLLLHVGDAVQSPHNLAQWQTDFWDPLTRGVPNGFSGSIPLLYARGNHDWDPDGANRYTAGMPAQQAGELNLTANAALSPSDLFAMPGTNHGDSGFALKDTMARPSGHRGVYFAYSPHPRCRIIVLDSNLRENQKAAGAAGNPTFMSEVDEMERWFLWEMGRQEWRNASMRLVVVHVTPWVEYWDKRTWPVEQHQWGSYVRARFARHFGAVSSATRRYEIPPATLVLSGHSHVYQRGFLPSWAASSSYFTAKDSSHISASERHSVWSDNRSPSAVTKPTDGTVYVTTGGAGGTPDTERVEDWGLFEMTRLKTYHFGHLTLDFAPLVVGSGPETEDDRDREEKWKQDGTRVYRIVGDQDPCNGRNKLTDRLIWQAVDVKGRTFDRFVILAKTCR